LMNGIKYLIDNSKDNGTLILNGIIQSANADKTYNVKINGIIYENISSILIPLAVGNVVKVIVPQGQYSQMIIIGKINTNSGGGEDPYVLPQATTETLGGVYVDNAMSSTSENPVQNKVVKSAIDSIQKNYNFFAVAANNKYSTAEQIVGVWTDGRPIYQKTISLSGTYSSETNIDLNIDNILKIVDYNGVTFSANGVCHKINNSYPSPSLQHCIMINSEKNKIYFRCGSGITGFDTISNITITIQYTKTTDDENSGVEYKTESDYSLEETVIGKWIDGKPLYQRVLIIEGLQRATWGTFDIGIQNIDSIIDLNAEWTYDMGHHFVGTESEMYGMLYFNYTNRGKLYYYYTYNTLNNLKVIIKYTKTTD
jgi:hypothetical protein